MTQDKPRKRIIWKRFKETFSFTLMNSTTDDGGNGQSAVLCTSWVILSSFSRWTTSVFSRFVRLQSHDIRPIPDTHEVRSGGVSDQWFLGSVPEVEAGEMTPEIQWDDDFLLFIASSRFDCASVTSVLRNLTPGQIGMLYWETLRDMMLHGY